MNNLSALFNPSSVAVFGASLDTSKVGGLIFTNLVEGSFTGNIYAINPGHKKLQGIRCYDSVKEIKAHIDLAVICTPFNSVEKILRQCGNAGIPVAIVLSRGPEDGKKHQRWTEKLLKTARKLNIRILGGNSMGILRPQLGLNLLYNRNQIRDGRIALVSQSAGLCDALLDWSEAHDVGYSTVMTMGDSFDIDIGETIYYLAREKHTQLLLVYMEHIHDADALLNSMRLAASLKPVLVFSGGTPVDPCMEAALTRCGAIILHTVDQLFPIVRHLLSGHIPQSEDILIISNAIGPDFLASRQLQQYGVDVIPITEKQQKQLSKFDPRPVSMEQALILPATASATDFSRAAEILGGQGKQPLLIIITPRPGVPFEELAEALLTIKAKEFVVICIMGAARVQDLRNTLRENGLSVFDTPADAVDVFAGLAAYRRQRELVKDLPLAYSNDLAPRIVDARQTIHSWIKEQHWTPLRSEITHLLAQFDLPLPPYLEAGSLKQALSHAENTGFPLRVKPQAPISIRRSEGIWASDMKSLRYLYLSLIAEQQRQKLWSRGIGVLIQHTDTSRERLLSLRLKMDDHPVWKRRLTIQSHSGLSVCELFPLSELLIQALLHRGQVPYTPALAGILLKISTLASEFPQISSMELDINLYDDDSARVEDARLELSDDYPQGRYQHLLLHPYPPDLEYQETLDDGKTFFVRPLIPRDADEADQFLKHVSRDSLYQRFLHSVPEMTDNMVRQLTLLDFHNELALIAGLDPEHEPVGIARFARMGEDCDFSILMRDDMHGKGLGKRLMKRLILGARLYGFRSIQGDVLPDNTAMLALAHSLGFSSELDVENGLIHIKLPLYDAGTQAA